MRCAKVGLASFPKTKPIPWLLPRKHVFAKRTQIFITSCYQSNRNVKYNVISQTHCQPSERMAAPNPARSTQRQATVRQNGQRKGCEYSSHDWHPKYFLSMENEFLKRGYLLPDGCKDLIDVLKLKEQKHSSESWLTTTEFMQKYYAEIEEKLATQPPIKEEIVIDRKSVV